MAAISRSFFRFQEIRAKIRKKWLRIFSPIWNWDYFLKGYEEVILYFLYNSKSQSIFLGMPIIWGSFANHEDHFFGISTPSYFAYVVNVNIWGKPSSFHVHIVYECPLSENMSRKINLKKKLVSLEKTPFKDAFTKY